MYLSHGTCDSHGVAILIPQNLSVDVRQIIIDEYGWYIILNAAIDNLIIHSFFSTYMHQQNINQLNKKCFWAILRHIYATLLINKAK